MTRKDKFVFEDTTIGLVRYIHAVMRLTNPECEERLELLRDTAEKDLLDIFNKWHETP